MGKTILSHVKNTIEKNSKVLRSQKIGTEFNIYKKIGTLIPSAKTELPIEFQRVYVIPCADCHNGQINRRTQPPRKEHWKDLEKNKTTNSLAQQSSRLHTSRSSVQWNIVKIRELENSKWDLIETSSKWYFSEPNIKYADHHPKEYIE